MKKKFFSAVLAVLAFAGFLKASRCEAVDPFDNIPAQTGAYFLSYPMHYSADKYVDSGGRIISRDIDLDLYQNLFRFAYYNRGTLKNTWVISAILPVGRIAAGKEMSSGLGDMTLAAGYWVIDDPENRTWAGIVGYADLPVGDYSTGRSVNMGSNVWKIKPSLILAKQFGNLDAELTLKYCISSKNDVTGTRNGNETDIEGYLGYSIRPNLTVGAHLNAAYGEKSVHSGAEVPDSDWSRYQVGPSVSWMPNDRLGIAFESLFDAGVKNGAAGRLLMSRILWKF